MEIDGAMEFSDDDLRTEGDSVRTDRVSSVRSGPADSTADATVLLTPPVIVPLVAVDREPCSCENIDRRITDHVESILGFMQTTNCQPYTDQGKLDWAQLIRATQAWVGSQHPEWSVAL